MKLNTKFEDICRAILLELDRLRAFYIIFLSKPQSEVGLHKRKQERKKKRKENTLSTKKAIIRRFN